MLIPEFNDIGDLPPGVYLVSLEDTIARFGSGNEQRLIVTDRLVTIANLVMTTGFVDAIVVFGSYVTDKPEPNDVDVILVMNDEFRLDSRSEEAKILFDHDRADRELGASIFWIRPAMLLVETLEQFIAGWQIKRDFTRRGILEIRL